MFWGQQLLSQRQHNFDVYHNQGYQTHYQTQ